MSSWFSRKKEPHECGVMEAQKKVYKVLNVTEGVVD